jgi:hypothetical protein
MKKPQHQLHVALAESIEANLNGLNEKHAKKLQKRISKAAKKLTDTYAKLLSKERQGHKQAALVTTPVALAKAALRVAKQTAKRAPGAVAPSAQKKPAAPLKQV